MTLDSEPIPLSGKAKMIPDQRNAYLSFTTGYLWGTLNSIRSSGQISVNAELRLDDAHKLLKPIIAKLYEQGDQPQPNRFLLFSTKELESLLASLFSNDKIWRQLIKNELDRRNAPQINEQQISSRGTPQTSGHDG